MDIEPYNIREKMQKLSEELLAVEEYMILVKASCSVYEVAFVMRSAIKEASDNETPE